MREVEKLEILHIARDMWLAALKEPSIKSFSFMELVKEVKEAFDYLEEGVKPDA